MPPAPITGGCLCGAVRFAAQGNPRVHYCHCDMCRRATGSAFAVLAWLPSMDIEWNGAPARRRSSPIAVREFCATFGTPLTLVYDDKPSETALHLGVFDNPEQYEPRYNYGVDQRLGWICTGVDLPGYRTIERW